MPGELILPLSQSSNVKLVGGKAAALQKLISAGFNVPRGFVVTASVSDDLRSVLKEFDRLGVKKVAVRSSAVSEDGANDAWAGQLDTFLEVTRDQLIDMVKACFESANSDRARAYAKQKGVDAGQVAVIIQVMVQAEVGGVAFSVHPVTNNKNQMVIEAVSGLGEKLVSGSVTPDTYVIDKASGKITEKHLSGAQNLSAKYLSELNKTVVSIEKLFNFPVDVEWAFFKSQLYILQSRPITTVG